MISFYPASQVFGVIYWVPVVNLTVFSISLPTGIIEKRFLPGSWMVSHEIEFGLERPLCILIWKLFGECSSTKFEGTNPSLPENFCKNNSNMKMIHLIKQ